MRGGGERADADYRQREWRFEEIYAPAYHGGEQAVLETAAFDRRHQ